MKFKVIQWPECQEYMGKKGWEENSYLINDDKGIEEFGSSAFFVRMSWLETLTS